MQTLVVKTYSPHVLVNFSMACPAWILPHVLKFAPCRNVLITLYCQQLPYLKHNKWDSARPLPKYNTRLPWYQQKVWVYYYAFRVCVCVCVCVCVRTQMGVVCVCVSVCVFEREKKRVGNSVCPLSMEWSEWVCVCVWCSSSPVWECDTWSIVKC